MSKYASERVFGGQRASVGRVVVVRKEHELFVGLIDNIYDDDGVLIVTPQDNDQSSEFSFVETKTAEDVEKMPEDSWTWPPRV